jgi:aryl-alcohol dehydrogenase-like predicted oxidoreductase
VASRRTSSRLCGTTAWGTLTYSPLAGGWLSGRWRKLDAVEQPALLAEETA